MLFVWLWGGSVTALAVWIVITLVSVYGTQWIARFKQRRPWLWGTAALVLGPVPLLIYFLPPGNSRASPMQ